MIFKKLITFAAILAIGLVPAFSAYAAGNIDATNKYSQFLNLDLDSSGTNDFVDWNPASGGATVTDSAVTGYVWGDTVGWINLNPAHGGVTNSCSGILGGYAWGQNTGWVNFAPTNSTGANQPKIDTTTGAFSGYVWSQNYGYIKLFSTDGGHPGVITTWHGCGKVVPPTTTGSTGGGCQSPYQIISGICQLPPSLATKPADQLLHLAVQIQRLLLGRQEIILLRDLRFQAGSIVQVRRFLQSHS